MTIWMRLAITVGYRVFVGKNMAYARLVAQSQTISHFSPRLTMVPEGHLTPTSAARCDMLVKWTCSNSATWTLSATPCLNAGSRWATRKEPARKRLELVTASLKALSQSTLSVHT